MDKRSEEVREFEYDINKSNINKKKHGISFEEAKKLWEDNNGIRTQIAI